MESINHSHPYVPRDLNLPDFIPGVLTQSTILGVYLSCSLLVVSLIWIVSGRFLKISKIDRLLMCWWAFTGLTHIILEGYFAFSPQFYTEKTACYLAEVWKEYSKGDSRYAGRDAGVVTVEAITAVLEGPASLLTVTTTMTLEDVLVIGGFSILSKPVISLLTTELVESEEKLIQSYKEVSRTKSHKTDHAGWLNHFIGSDDELRHATFLSLWLSRYAIANKTSYRYILQIAISLGQLYGTAVYFITSYLEGDNFAASTYYYYIYYVFANSFWVWIPTLIVIRSWKKICAAFETEFKDEKTKTC